MATGVVVQELRYDEFGRITLDTNPGFQPFGFAGGLYDHQTGLIRYRARDYDPEIGRWTTPDPSGFAGGLNLYGYADQNPQSFIDRNGENPVAIALAWGLIEAGLTIWDIYETGTTLMDPCASLGDKILSGGSMTMSAAGPGPKSLYKGLGKSVEKVLGAKAGGAAVSAATPVGRKGQPLNVVVPKGRTALNAPTNINGRDFTGHALDKLQGQGIPPSAVESAIRSADAVPGKVPGTTAYYDSANNLTVITDSMSGRVVTVALGRIKQ